MAPADRQDQVWKPPQNTPRQEFEVYIPPARSSPVVQAASQGGAVRMAPSPVSAERRTPAAVTSPVVSAAPSREASVDNFFDDVPAPSNDFMQEDSEPLASSIATLPAEVRMPEGSSSSANLTSVGGVPLSLSGGNAEFQEALVLAVSAVRHLTSFVQHSVEAGRRFPNNLADSLATASVDLSSVVAKTKLLEGALS